MPRRIPAPTVLSYATITLVTLLFSFILLVYPYDVDDYWYLDEIYNKGPRVTGSNNIIDWIWYSFQNRYMFDNARSGNYLADILITLPRWIPMSLTCIVFAIGYLLTIKYAGITLKNWRWIAFLSFLLIFGPIWQDAMFSQMYAFNYIWGFTVLMCALLFFESDKKYNAISAFFIGLLASSWHDCVACTIVGGCSLALVINRKMLCRWRVMMILGGVCGLAWLLAAPGWWFRVTYRENLIHTSRLVYLWAPYTFVGIWCLCIVLRRWRNIALSPKALILLVSTIGLSILVLLSDTPRSAMPAMLLSVAVIPWMLRQMWPSLFHTPGIIRNIFAISMIAVCVVHLGVVCMRTVEINRQFKCIIEQIDANQSHEPDISIFAPITYNWQASPLTLLRPRRHVFENRNFSIYNLSAYKGYHRVSIIPEELQYYRYGMGTLLPGSDSIRLYRGHIISPNISDTLYSRGTSKFGSRYEYSKLFHGVFTGADGRNYDYIIPQRSLQSSFIREPSYFHIDLKSYKTY